MEEGGGGGAAERVTMYRRTAAAGYCNKMLCVCANQDKTLRKLVAEFERAFKKLKEVAWQ